jgi:hypothetical protein
MGLPPVVPVPVRAGRSGQTPAAPAPEIGCKIPAKVEKENPLLRYCFGCVDVTDEPSRDLSRVRAFPQMPRQGPSSRLGSQRMKNRLPRIRLVAFRTASAAPLVGS